MRLTGTPVFGLSLCEREAHASLENALEVLLSRTSLDLGLRVSHNTSNHPLEAGRLSLLHWLMWVYPTKTGDARVGQAGRWLGARSVAVNVVLG